MEPQKTDDDELAINIALAGVGDDCEFILFYNHVRFIILLERSDPESDEVPIEETMLQRLDEAEDDPDELVYDRCVEDIRELTISHAKNMIYKLSSQRRGSAQDITLEEKLNPTTFVLQLRTVGGELRVVQRGGIKEAKYNYENVYLPSNIVPFGRQELPFVSTKDIRAIDKLYLQKVYKVSWKGGLYVFKNCASEGQEKQMVREMEIFRKLSQIKTPADGSVLIPRLHAIVESRRGVVGFLEEYIENSKSLDKCIRDFDDNPGDNGKTTTADEEKRKWIYQIKSSVQFLHQHGLVWGDAKDKNVLIDKERNAWLVDFGGSWSQGWVDRELAETVEGDLQGLQRIEDFINGAEVESDNSTVTM